MTKAIIKTLLSKLLNTPLVIERGTNGMWTYRKWSDGTAECWGVKSLGSKAITTAYGNGFYAQADTISFPSGLFASISAVTSSLKDGAGYGAWFDQSTTSASALVGYTYGVKSITLTLTVDVYAIGKWK